MQTINDVHQQFAEYFKHDALKPFIYLVSKKLAEGHICLDLDDAAEELADNPYYQDVRIDRAGLNREDFVDTTAAGNRPFVLHNRKLYLQRYFNYETQILRRLRAFEEAEASLTPAAMADVTVNAEMIRSLFVGGDNSSLIASENIDWQLVAAVTGVLNQFTIITGGPGTGKTTTVAKILAILYAVNPLLRVALAAPTGKAAVRMAESLKSASKNIPPAIRTRFESISPATIHRLLIPVYGTPYFRHNTENPLPFDVIIVDESSMIDVALFAKLLNAVGSGTRLILLGDKNQLASVEAGSLFGDLSKSQPAFAISASRAQLINGLITDPSRKISPEFISDNTAVPLFQRIVELRKSHRFSSDQGIGRFSRALITGDHQLLKSFVAGIKDNQVIIDTLYDEMIFEKFIIGYAAYVNEPDIATALQRFNDLRVLCAVREGNQGLYAMNRAIEKYLQQQKLIRTGNEFYEHRPVIVNKNYYDLGLYNGDIGIIRSDENGVLKAWFEGPSGELKAVSPGFIGEAETVFAMTIHKSQGSEYGRVLVVLPDDPEVPILTAELLYTAVTRAKLSVTIQATDAVIMKTAQRRVKRASGIIERFDEVV